MGDKAKEAVRLYAKGCTCAQSVLVPFADELGLDEDNIEDAIAEMIPTLRENKGEPFGSFKKLTMEDAAEIYRLAL